MSVQGSAIKLKFRWIRISCLWIKLWITCWTRCGVQVQGRWKDHPAVVSPWGAGCCGSRGKWCLQPGAL